MKNINLSIPLILLALFSVAFNAKAQTPVANHGALSVSGNRIVNQYGDTVSFAGNSMFWSNTGWEGAPFYNASCVNWLQSDWNATIVRAAMGVEDQGGYLTDASNKIRLKAVVDAAIANEMYVIIDWHSHHAEDYQADAITFFQEMATTYGAYDNVIYEIYNEPLQVSWGNTIKPYAEAVTAAIRAIDPDNLIVVGTPTWSQDVDVASLDPITGYPNIAYTLHFYAGTHGQSLRNKAITAMNNGIALFVTEWGTVDASGNGAVATTSVNEWTAFMCQNKLSHCNWSVNDKNEGASAVIVGASPTGNWSASELTTSGTLVKSIIQTWDANCSAQVNLVANDAGISNIAAPNGTICSDSIHPIITLNNYGSSDLTSATINYNIDGNPNLVYTWNGILTSGQSIVINLPSQFVTAGPHDFNAFTVLPNGVLDSVNVNDSSLVIFTSNGSGTMVGLILNTDCWADEVSWILEDSQNNTVDSGSGYTNGASGAYISTQYCLIDSCYEFTINDSFGDGLNGMPSGCPINGHYDILNLETGDTLATMIAVGGAYGFQEANAFCLTLSCTLTASSIVTNESCATANDGSISVMASNGTGTYTYTLGGISNTTGIFNGLAPGIHVVSIIDALGCSETVSESIVAATNFGSTDLGATICVGDQVSLGAYGGGSYSWSQGGNQIGTNNSITVSPILNTTYDVDITSGVCIESFSVTVNVNSVPDAGFTSADFCESTNNVITNVMTSGGMFSYDGSDGSNINSINGIISNAAAGSSYLITYSVVTNGCANQSTQLVFVNTSPQIDAGSTVSVCDGGAVILSAINPDNAQISWNNNVIDNSSFVPTSTGTYTVTADLNGCIVSDDVLVNVSPIPSVDAGSDLSICAGSQVTLSAGNPNNAQVSWDNNVTDNVPFTPLLSPITCTVTATLNGCTSTDDIVVTTVNSPIIDAGIDQVVCEGDVVTLVANNPDNASITWNNNVVDGVSFTPITTGTYTVNADLNGCLSSDIVLVNVSPIPSVDAGNDLSICTGSQVTLSAVNPNNAQVSWDNNVVDNTPFTPLSSPITYTVTATLNGCASTDDVVVTTVNLPIIDAGIDQVVCEGDVVTLVANNPDNAQITWDNNVVDGVSFVAPLGGTVYTATADLNGCLSTDLLTVLVTSAPVITGVISSDDGTNSGTIDVTISSGYTISSIDWNNSETTEDLMNLAAGTYTVTVIDENGCSASETFIVESSVGVSLIVLDELMVYPNPTYDFVTIKYLGEFKVEVLDPTGRVVQRETGFELVQCNLNRLTRGTYFIRINDGVQTIKLIKL